MEETAARSMELVGSTVGAKWRLDALIGVGGMAAVYAATHRNGARAAIKLLHPEVSRDEEARTRFLREGYVANSVGHDGVVRVLDDDLTEDGIAFLVMELLEGETLDAHLERVGALPAKEVLWIADRTLDVLAAAHEKEIVHRDLKPQNLFLTNDGRVKLLDFGVARAGRRPGRGATQIGTTMGTPGFMAPEQAQGKWEEVDGRTDLWSLGATMYTALTGDYLHAGKTPNLQLLEAMTRPAPPIQSLLGDLPDEVAEIVDRALAFAMPDRWQDARAMQAAIRTAEREGPKVTSPPEPVAVANVRAPSRPSEIRGESIPATRRSTIPRRWAVIIGLPALVGAAAAAGLIVAARRAALVRLEAPGAMGDARTSPAIAPATPVRPSVTPLAPSAAAPAPPPAAASRPPPVAPRPAHRATAKSDAARRRTSPERPAGAARAPRPAGSPPPAAASDPLDRRTDAEPSGDLLDRRR